MIDISWKEWVLFAISSAAFVMSLATWIITIIHNRKKIRIIPIAKYLMVKSHHLYVVIENLSRIPISITGISIVMGTSLVPCSHTSQRYMSHTTKTGDVIEYQKHEMTLGLPIALGDLGAVSGVLNFVDSEHIVKPDATSLTLRVSTTRGVLVETISLDVPKLGTVFP